MPPFWDPMNIMKILKKIRNDPLSNYLVTLDDRTPYLGYADAINSYLEQYIFFILCCERLLKAMSIERRYRNGPYWSRKAGIPFTKHERWLAAKRNETGRFLGLDFDNLLIHSRILLDRASAITKIFLKNQPTQPSFTSFTKHREFFLRTENIPYSNHETYAKYVREQTGWFTSSLKLVRDKFIVHRNKPFQRFYGWPKYGFSEMEMLLFTSATDDSGNLGTVEHKVVNPLDLIFNIVDYLSFTGNYMKEYAKKGNDR